MPNNRLEQRKRRTSQIFEIENENLAVSIDTPRRVKQWKVPLVFLLSEPVRYRQRALLPTFVAVLVVVVLYFGFTIGLIAALTSTPSSGVAAAIYLGALILAGMAMRWFKKLGLFHSVDLLSFNSRNGNRLDLWFENPTKAEFDSFVTSLKEAVEMAHLNKPESTTSVSTEILKLKRLLEDGTISQAQFEAAKNKIVGLDGKGPIGF